MVSRERVRAVRVSPYVLCPVWLELLTNENTEGTEEGVLCFRATPAALGMTGFELTEFE